MDVRVDNVNMQLGARMVCRDVSLSVESGRIFGLVGPNGSGKSTLLRCIYRVLRPDSGAVFVHSESIWGLDAKEVARRLAVVVQEPPNDFDFTVREVVQMGRIPHKGPFQRTNAQDNAVVEEALRQVGVSELHSRVFHTLSGGEKQRTLIARALAQRAQVLVLDEPTNHLDIRHQLELLELVGRLGVTTIMAIHDLNLAATYCDVVAVLSDGQIASLGQPDAVLTPDLLAEVFGVAVEVAHRVDDGRPYFTFHPLSREFAATAETKSEAVP